ncbi:35831_t:CDS:1, partial [Racocetra persica]
RKIKELNYKTGRKEVVVNYNLTTYFETKKQKLNYRTGRKEVVVKCKLTTYPKPNDERTELQDRKKRS